VNRNDFGISTLLVNLAPLNEHEVHRVAAHLLVDNCGLKLIFDIAKVLRDLGELGGNE